MDGRASKDRMHPERSSNKHSLQNCCRAYANRVAAFRNGLGEQEFTEGRNIRIEFRWAEGRYDLLPALAADLVSGNVAVLVSSGGDATSGFTKAATSTIPIVAAIGGFDPVKSDLVDSLIQSLQATPAN
jgi:putative ABC transport system substrate-binding protein